MGMRWLRGILIGLLVGLLAACSSGGTGLSQTLVQQAIALQVWQTQATLSQQLKLAVPEPEQIKVRNVVVQVQSPLTIQKHPGYKLQGTYDFTLQLPKRQISERGNVFEIYLQSQAEGKTWRLAQRQADAEGNQSWVTQLIAPDL